MNPRAATTLCPGSGRFPTESYDVVPGFWWTNAPCPVCENRQTVTGRGRIHSHAPRPKGTRP